MTATPALQLDASNLDKLQGARIRTLRLQAGLTQRTAALTATVSLGTWQRWESGTQTPRLHRGLQIASALSVPVAALFVPDGYVAVTDVQLTPEAVSAVRRLGAPEAERLAAMVASQLPAMILATCRTTTPQHKPDGRGKPRRSRQQVLAGIAQANAMRAAKANRPPTAAGGTQDRNETSVGGLPGALTAED